MTQERLVVAAAILDDLTTPTVMLSARRSAPASLAGRWEFPGGKVEPGERDVDALHRELGEELGVAAALGDLVPAPDGGDWPLPNGFRLRLWLATIDRVPRPLLDHDDLRWLDLDRAHEVPWLDPDVPIVDAVLTRLRRPSSTDDFGTDSP